MEDGRDIGVWNQSKMHPKSFISPSTMHHLFDASLSWRILRLSFCRTLVRGKLLSTTIRPLTTGIPIHCSLGFAPRTTSIPELQRLWAFYINGTYRDQSWAANFMNGVCHCFEMQEDTCRVECLRDCDLARMSRFRVARPKAKDVMITTCYHLYFQNSDELFHKIELSSMLFATFRQPNNC